MYQSFQEIHNTLHPYSTDHNSDLSHTPTPKVRSLEDSNPMLHMQLKQTSERWVAALRGLAK